MRQFIFNSPKMEWRRRNLRGKETEEEKILWERIRNGKLGNRFKRQYSIVNYVVDFYCPSLKLAIELDGQNHANKQEYDKYRTKLLNAYGINEIRFWNYEIANNIEKVLAEIKAIIAIHTSAPLLD
ncbi:MAG: hypothetical protein G01um101416_461 [Microgenomates group bacterium Gr01-1014_16]|nr:MAG: hypothetical protein G01um101416_461 [Microgenomates group bacterium Gr01-1014_16]